MAILWDKVQAGNHYQVRSAGATRRLYCNGVFHSQFNPHTPLTGHTWDLLMIPAFFIPGAALRRVLLLGVGGGTVIRQLQHYLAPEAIVGVDCSAVHLYLARRFFGVGGNSVSLQEADAIQWLEHYSGPAFDMIIDDLFGDALGDAARAVTLNARWLRRLFRHLTPTGVVVANFSCSRELRDSIGSVRRSVSVKAAFQLTTAADENAVGVFLRRQVDSTTLRRNLKATPGLDPAAKSNRLNYRIRRICLAES